MDKKCTAIVLSAGRGSRMGTDTPKQYLDLCGRPVLYYSLKAFQDSFIDEIIIVAAKDDFSYILRISMRPVNCSIVTTPVYYWLKRKHSLIKKLCHNYK